MSDKINVFVRNVDKKTWELFKVKAVSNCGRLWRVMGQELSKALAMYVESDKGRHTHTFSDAPDPSRKVSRKVMAERELLEQEIGKVVESGGSVPLKMLHNLIRRTCAVKDHRSIRSRVEMLVATGFLERDWNISLEGKVFRVIGNEANNIRRVQPE